jgi:polysaccharide biosynthesis protein PelA
MACSTTRSVGDPLAHVTRWWILLGAPGEVTAIAWKRAADGADLVILNYDLPLPLEVPTTPTIRLAYLSIGEAEATRPYWPQVRGKSFVIEPNPAWPDNVRVDIRDRRWQGILLDQEIPRLLAEGYRGIMLDTLDSAPYLERKDPVRFAGCRQALGEFLSRLRRTFPGAILLANGTETLVDAAPYVDGYVTEGIFATYQVASEGYRQTTSDERGWRLSQVQAALARVQHPVFSIEYAGGVDVPAGLSEWATRQAREHGFRPYVTTKSIDRLPTVPFPQ